MATCSSYDANKSAASIGNITNYTCIFKHEFEVTGSSLAEKPEAWSNREHTCTGYVVNEIANDYTLQPLALIQASCVGHKLPTGDLRGIEFEAIRDGKTIQPDSINNIIENLKTQINLRLESKKYQEIYLASGHAFKNYIDETGAINKSYALKKDSTINSLLEPASVGEYAKKSILTKLINCIAALQPSGSITVNSKYKLPKYDQRPEQSVSLPSKPLISKNSLSDIITAIKRDINDCICYGDCNGYSVCWCYGNCNHY